MKTEWLILADAAQVVAGKLYVIGGGWDTLAVTQQFPVTRQIALAAAFTISWNETNQKHSVELEIATDDGSSVAKIEGQLEAGRPPGIPLGTSQRAQLAATLGLEFKTPGVYSIVSRISGQEDARTHFNVVDATPRQVPTP
jgi:hypothetical protein